MDGRWVLQGGQTCGLELEGVGSFTALPTMILPQLLLRFAKHRDDAVFYAMQATDSIRWLEEKGVRLGAGLRVLDLGCGHGVFGGQLRRMGCKVTFADEANYLLPEHRDGEWKAADLDGEGWEALGRYDLVVFSNVLEHLRHPREFLARADRLLAPGGRLFLSWTNWLSPWGGHEFSPLHYLGPRFGPILYDRIARRPRFHRPGDNLFITHIGRTLGWLEEDGRLVVEAMAPRYYTEWEGLVKVPLVREFLTWNCALLLGLRGGDEEGSGR